MIRIATQDKHVRADPVGRVWNPISYDDRIRSNTFWRHPNTYSVSRLYPLTGSDEFPSNLCCQTRRDPADRICRIRYDSVLSDTSESPEFVVSDDRWKKIFTVKSFHFLASKHVGLYYNWEIPLMGFDRFLQYRFWHSHLYSVIGCKRKARWLIGSLQAVFDWIVHVMKIDSGLVQRGLVNQSRSQQMTWGHLYLH